MTTNDQLADMLRVIDERVQRLEVYTKGIMGKLLAPEEITQLEYDASQVGQPNRLSTAGR